MESNDHIDIRGRVRAHAARQRVIARLSAPADWQAELRRALGQSRPQRQWWERGGDLRLFAESFAIFFTAAMAFLI